MAKSKKKKATRYARRLVQDENVQQHVREAASALRGAYDRIARDGGKAVEDKKLYERLREAATSTRKAGLALQHGERTPKRRGRVVIPLAASAAALVLVNRGRGEKQHEPGPSATDDLGTT